MGNKVFKIKKTKSVKGTKTQLGSEKRGRERQIK